MKTNLILATFGGVVVCQSVEGQWREVRRSLEDRRVTSVIARQGVILAGTTSGIFRSDDLGRSWQAANNGLSLQHIRWLAYHPDISDFELAGTEPAGIFVSRDGALTWHACPEVEVMRQKYGWRLPYSPEAGCVRGFAFLGQRAYAAVEDGCALVSEDAGESWNLAEGSRGGPDHYPADGFIHSDVHSIAVHPTSRELVFAPTGGGFYGSEDGGKTWRRLYPNCYCRAVWLDPGDPEHLVLGPADGVDRNGRIEETFNGGNSWQSASNGLEVPWERHMVERFKQVDSQGNRELMAVLSNGELLSSRLGRLNWRHILPDIPAVAAVATLNSNQ
jgi:photosystem II stability/assembly factor-like uncharacterized protein